MPWRSTSMVAALTMLSCSPDSSSVEPTTGGDTAANEPRDRATGARSSTNARGCSQGAVCGDHGATCREGRTICTCASPCTGADMPDAFQGNTWSCRTPERGCPDAVPTAGTRCPRAGLRCGYGTCGGATATCEDRQWKILEYAPPPSAEF